MCQTLDELNKRFNIAASQVKLSTGVCNNAAWCAVLDAHDNIKKHPIYRDRVTHEYRRALKEFHEYELRLLYANKNRMFHVADMSESTRKKYGNITDREYYDFWASTGATAYAGTRHHMTALVNKLRMALQGHGIDNPELLAWPIAALACLRLAVHNLDTTLQVMQDVHRLPMSVLRSVFRQFSLERVETRWKQAIELTEPGVTGLVLTQTETRNIQLGLDVLQEEWSDTKKHLRIVSDTAEYYDDVFRTRGEMKKMQREMSDIEKEIQKEEKIKNYERIKTRLTSIAG